MASPDMHNFDIIQAFAAGERPDRRVHTNAEFMTRVEGLKPYAHGCVGFPDITPFDAEGDGPVATHPYPYLHRGKKATYAFYDTAVHLYDEGNLAVSATPLPIYDIAEAIQPTSAESLTDPNIDDTGNGDVWAPDTSGNVSVDYEVEEAILFAAADDGDYAVQNVGNQANALTNGTRYRGTITIEGWDGGGVKVQAGDGGDAKSVSRVLVGDGTFEFDVTADVSADGDLLIIADVGTSGDLLTTLKVTNVSLKPITTIVIPAGGGVWQVADFGDVWLASKDGVTVTRFPYYSDYELVAFTYATHGLKMRAVSAVGNQLVAGGIEAATLFNGGASDEERRWTELWEHWINASGAGVMTHKDLQMNSTTLLISTPSGGDFRYPLIQEMAMFGFPSRSYASDDIVDNYHDVIIKQELTFLPLPWKGKNLANRQLGNGFVSYCTDGISYVDFSTMGATTLRTVGLKEAGAIIGDTSQHVFIDANNEMFRLTAELQLERLNHSERLETFTGTITGSWDEEDSDAYFNDGTQAFVQSLTGFAKVVRQLPTSLFRVGHTLVGAIIDTEDDSILIETGDFDMGLDVQKTLVYYGISAFGVDNLRGQVKYRNERVLGDAGYKSLSPVRVNRSGVTYPGLPGRTFRIQVTGNLPAEGETRVERINVGFRLIDKRSLEGVVDANR